MSFGYVTAFTYGLFAPTPNPEQIERTECEANKHETAKHDATLLDGLRCQRWLARYRTSRAHG
eukprot:1241871-Alexandrium_andersonii.AAC.1